GPSRIPCQRRSARPEPGRTIEPHGSAFSRGHGKPADLLSTGLTNHYVAMTANARDSAQAMKD
ncbi:hypothetical protein, partial [Klebsiella pneumoniae]|uniref:hypothetical protein n=1 Tax=Klebsiella pneumoniae TaxID=573 RepID=UPI001D0DCFF7